jgi:hypothetical protein
MIARRGHRRLTSPIVAKRIVPTNAKENHAAARAETRPNRGHPNGATKKIGKKKIATKKTARTQRPRRTRKLRQGRNA